MILRSHTVWLVPVALTFLGFGPGAARATAQTTYEINAVYDLEVTLKEIAPGVSEVTVIGESADAPYGLTNLRSKNYSQVDPDTGVSTSGPDAAEFGLEGLPILTDVLFGSGNDSLIGTSSATAVTDLENLTASADGILDITNGTGKFTFATGTLTLSDNYTISPDPTAPLIGQAVVTGSIKVVPEPETATGTLLGMGVIGAGFLLRRRHLAPSLVNSRNTQS